MKRSGKRDCRQSEKILALRPFSCELSCTAKCLGSLACAFFGWLFVVLPEFHFAKYPLTLQFLFQRAKCLINVVVANLYLHQYCHPLLPGIHGDPENAAIISCPRTRPDTTPPANTPLTSCASFAATQTIDHSRRFRNRILPVTSVDDEFATDKVSLCATYVQPVCEAGCAIDDSSVFRLKFGYVTLDDRGQVDCDRSVFVLKG